MIAKPGAGFQDVEHTADLALRVWADSEPELYRQAILGMLSLMGAEAGEGRRIKKRFSLRAVDREGLLIQLLNRVLLEIEVQQIVPVEMHYITRDKTLIIDLVCLPLRSLNKTIKAATYNNIKIFQDGERLMTTIVFDV